MKIAFSLVAAAVALAFAGPTPGLAADQTITAGLELGQVTFDAKGKRTSGSGRSKPRVPGGSGCDDPRDLIEHPECRR